MEGKNLTNEIRFYPLLVSSGGLEHQSEMESDQIWEKLDAIPENNKKILLGANIIENLYNAERTFQWEPYSSARLAYFVRELFFQNISQSEFYKAIEAHFSEKYGNRLNEILAYINNTILTSQPDLDEPDEDDYAENAEQAILNENAKQHTLLDALSKYPYIGNQAITTDNIKLKSQVALVRPTLTNWLKSYRDELGIGMHDAVARAKFLFESQNTKKLPSVERDRIHALVRSLEDNELLNIDTKKQIILFLDQEEEGEELSVRTEVEDEAPSQDIFERFQNINTASVQTRVELGGVGTQTFGGGKMQNGEPAIDETGVLARIKNMTVNAPVANAPAPKEDFIETFTPVVPAIPTPRPQMVPKPEVSVPMGTLRFSAKHILPAERQNLQRPVTVPQEPVPRASNIEHFRPQEVVIPGATPQMFRAVPPKPVGPAEMRVTLPTPAPVAPPAPVRPILTPVVPPLAPILAPNVRQVPQPQAVEEPTSMFRIKPSRD